MPLSPPRTDRESVIRALFDGHIEMYAGRDHSPTRHFRENFSGFTGGGGLSASG